MIRQHSRINSFLLITVIFLTLFSISAELHHFITLPVTTESQSLPSFFPLPNGTLPRIGFYFSFFTVLSNSAALFSSLILLFKPDNNSFLFRVLRLDSLVCLIITAAVYNLLLRTNHHPTTPLLIFTNENLHLIIPLLAVIQWFIYGPRERISKSTIGWSMIPPIFYLIYTEIRGALTNNYPYFFLDPNQVGISVVILATVAITTFFLVIAFLLYLRR